MMIQTLVVPLMTLNFPLVAVFLKSAEDQASDTFHLS